ncbi:hypothetical protein RJ640_015924 [Escallonia rubra]|uniref:Xylanase inhibitor C-terminal domain-containing protein n=1 Tax=Escallonia rubra TaxID=112253 RepID=A0AA88R0D6_9ASTE|nr:hypothetical protein RJ640_015924 [Escallonia rubra]
MVVIVARHRLWGRLGQTSPKITRFDLAANRLESEIMTAVPPITAHFTGAYIVLLPTSTFLEVEEGITCLTMIPTTLELAIWGNLSQMDFLIGYDLVKQEATTKHYLSEREDSQVQSKAEPEELQQDN